jgi:hypothetical protein
MGQILYGGGGFGDEGLANASDSLRRRAAEADAEYEREGIRQARQRELETERLREGAIGLSLRMAEERGEALNLRDRLQGVGRTKSEALSFYSAVADVEDRKREVATLRRFQAFQQHEQDLSSGDTTAPSEADISELEAMQARAGKFREKQGIIQQARQGSAADRRAEREADQRAEQRRDAEVARRAAAVVRRLGI